MSEKTLLLIDSHALVYRAYYAYPPTLTTTDGEPINAVYGFTNLLLEVLNKFNPSHVIAVFDSAEPTIRQSEFTQYKANRKKSDDSFIVQLPMVDEVVEAFGIPILKIPGIEADDIIGTIDEKYSGKLAKTIIVTGDQDIFQLIDNDTFVYLAGRKFSESRLFNAEDVYSKLEITPSQVTDYKAIAGDPSDNIPGIPGIGKKGAVDLIREFENLENIYANLDKVAKRYQQKLIEGQESGFMSKALATIHRDVPISFDFNKCGFDTFDLKRVNRLFDELNFKSVKPKLNILVKKKGLEEHLDTNPNLFGDREELEVEIKEWTESEFKNEEIFIYSECENIKKNPLHWRISKMLILDGDNIYRLNDQGKIRSLFEKLRQKTVLAFEYKQIYHCMINLGFTEIIGNIKYFDLGLLGMILSAGQSGTSIKSVLNFFKFDSSDLAEINLKNFPKLYSEFKELLEDSQRELIKMENDLLKVVVEMERNGINVDSQKFKEFEETLQIKLNQTEEDIYKLVGHEFNINSPKQLSDILFKELRLSSDRKTKGGSLSTNEIVLKKLIGVHPIVEMILDYRELGKLLSTYVLTLPLLIEPLTGRIHAIFDQMGAVSGRFSSKNPNLQNIPKGTTQGVDIRDGFIPRDGSIFVSFDYSQQELRLLADFAGEADMIESFNNDLDIHKLTASEIFGIPVEQIEKAQRAVGKTVNFSVVYGISAFGLSERMNIPRSDAVMFISAYYKRYPKVKEYFDEVIKNVLKKGYSESILGRRRKNQLIFSNNKALRSAAERELINFGIQGSAADIMKCAMVSIYPILKKYPARLIAQIHDELLFEYDGLTLEGLKNNIEFKQFVKEIQNTMQNVYKMKVKFDVDVSVGKSWGHMEDLGKD